MSLHLDPNNPAGGPQGSDMPRFEAITVSVNYADYLAETLPHNLPHFDRYLVITDRKDRETQEVCRRLSVSCYATDAFYRDGPFNKARGIDFGIGFLRYNQWVCHIDADTYLPPMARRLLERRQLDPEKIYGCDRVNCVGYENWKKFETDHHLQHDYMCRVRFPSGMYPNHRILLNEHGYCPIGYMQLWHAKHGFRYPIASGTAERDDVLMSLQFEPENRELLSDIVAVHLQAREETLGVNWSGRKSPPFRPVKPA